MDISSVAMVFERRHAVLLPAHDYGSMAIATGQLAAVGLWYILLRRRFNGLFELFAHIYKLASRA